MMQEKRHSVEYDPNERYTHLEVLVLIDTCENAMTELRASPRPDRRAFAAWGLLSKNGS
jgi:hypothetical protein